MSLSEEVLMQLEVEDVLAQEMGHLSLNAISGTDEGEEIKIRALVNNKVMQVLIDSGSSHSFVNPSFLELANVKATVCSPVLVKVANGESMVSAHKVSKLNWWVPNHTFHTDMRVLYIGAYDAILGFDWLKEHSPMVCHWDNKMLEFVDAGQQVVLHGILPLSPSVPEIPAIQLLKCLKGNEVWSLAVIEQMPH